MIKKSILIISIFCIMLMFGTATLAANTHTNNAITNTMHNAGNAVTNGAHTMGNTINNGVHNAGNALSGAIGNTTNAGTRTTTGNAGVRTTTGAYPGTANSYTATRTGVFTPGTTANIWTWAIVGITAVIIGGLVWYYVATNNSDNKISRER